MEILTLILNRICVYIIKELSNAECFVLIHPRSYFCDFLNESNIRLKIFNRFLTFKFVTLRICLS